MHFLILYISKVSLALAFLFLFYQVFLRRLTFYSWNRFFLVGYSIAAFVLPFIDLQPALQLQDGTEHAAVRWIPALGGKSQAITGIDDTGVFNYNWLWLVLLLGSFILLARLIIQVASFLKLKKKARLLVVTPVPVYQVDKPIVPFSFGNSIFINTQQHSETELMEIMKHEFVHVRQRHSLDLLFGEILCILCWFNPFAWLIRYSIRQNLEFIADNAVVSSGINKKEYQYLLLKVMGNTRFSFSNAFNFSSLKKRIAMMNKLKSARIQLLKFLFVLPLLTVMLLAFRSHFVKPAVTKTNDKQVAIAGLVFDGVKNTPLSQARIYCKELNKEVYTDNNGYFLLQLPFENKPLQFSLSITHAGYKKMTSYENWGNFYDQSTYSRYAYTFAFYGLSNKDNNDGAFSMLAGNTTSLDGLSYQNVLDQWKKYKNKADEEFAVEMEETSITADTISVLQNSETKKLPGNAKQMFFRENKVDVLLKDGNILMYDLDNEKSYAAFQKRFGNIVPVVKRTSKPTIAENDLAVIEEPIIEVSPLPGSSIVTANISESLVNLRSDTIEITEQPARSVTVKGIVEIGGLTMSDEQQLIIVDGKEYDRKKGPLKGTFKIEFLKPEAAKKKYGEKGKNGAVIAQSIR